MPITFFTSPELDLVVGRWSGQVTTQEILANIATYVTDAHYRPGRPELNDLSRVVDIDIDFDRLRGLIQQVNRLEPERHEETFASIWAPGDAAFAAARMYQQLIDFQGGMTLDIFRDQHDALAAHGLTEQSVETLLEAYEFHPPTRLSGENSSTANVTG